MSRYDQKYARFSSSWRSERSSLAELSRYITAVSVCRAADSDKWPLHQYNI